MIFILSCCSRSLLFDVILLFLSGFCVKHRKNHCEPSYLRCCGGGFTVLLACLGFVSLVLLLCILLWVSLCDWAFLVPR